MIYRFNLDHQL